MDKDFKSARTQKFLITTARETTTTKQPRCNVYIQVFMPTHTSMIKSVCRGYGSPLFQT